MSDKIKNSDDAREYLLNNLIPEFNDKTFYAYVRKELAGDFAYQLANYLLSQSEPAQLHPPKDWPEDFSHENGNYSCRCCKCDRMFHGHKRRVVCKECVVRPAQVSQELSGWKIVWPESTDSVGQDYFIGVDNYERKDVRVSLGAVAIPLFTSPPDYEALKLRVAELEKMVDKSGEVNEMVIPSAPKEKE